jgi:hypothetical protein
VSANLSPCHKTLEENPIYLPEPGSAELPITRKALLFDETIEQWIRSGDPNMIIKWAVVVVLWSASLLSTPRILDHFMHSSKIFRISLNKVEDGEEAQR